MIEIVRKIIANVLTALYQPFGFSMILAILCMFVYIDILELGLKNVFNRWLNAFRGDSMFRRLFFLIFYTAMILFRTLLNRTVWVNTLSDVIGVWGIYDKDGLLTTEVIENILLFVPFTVLLMWSMQEKFLDQLEKKYKIIWKAIKVVFIFSLIIEFLQLFLHLGTFQLSDLFYNTLGGFIGGLLYWIAYKIAHRKNKKKNINENQGN